MIIELINVGSGMLGGNQANRAVAHVSKQCAVIGLPIDFQTIVAARKKALSMVLETAFKRADLVIVIGGSCVSEKELMSNLIAEICGKELSKKTMAPKEAVSVEQTKSGALGWMLLDTPVKVVVMNGTDDEIVTMFEKSMRQYLEEHVPGTVYTQTVKLCGVDGKTVEAKIKDLMDAEKDATITISTMPGEVHVRVSARGEDAKDAKKNTKPVVKEIKARLVSEIYTTEEDVTLEKSVEDLLLSNEMTLTCAESCTGGLLAARLVNVPGCSDTFKSCVVTYSNKAKRKLLGVKKATLQKYGAVSKQVAEEMVKGAVFTSKCDVAVATTGIAGPDGGTDEKPVGLVYIACNVKGNVTVKECHFNGDRTDVREQAAAAALTLLRNCILEYISKTTFGKK